MTLTWADWLALFTHFASLSLLAVGGVIATAPDMHRYLVGDRSWLTDAQFNSSVALARQTRQRWRMLAPERFPTVLQLWLDKVDAVVSRVSGVAATDGVSEDA